MKQLAAMALALALCAPVVWAKDSTETGTAAQIDYAGFTRLTNDVEAYRRERLLDLAAFQRMAHEGDTLILDARSASAFAAGHIEGAVNLPFSDFTSESLHRVIGDTGRRVLIYCNNNFANDVAPVILKRAPLALNIPTFINLYGYGYANIYELGDVVDMNDPAVGWVRG